MSKSYPENALNEDVNTVNTINEEMNGFLKAIHGLRWRQIDVTAMWFLSFFLVVRCEQ